ncbi:serine hydrolase FSH [Pelagophyceae sp. CCMP2097]|nr:serine hydrolase FSH [Pelagophyceae sp. CCMP2097]
MAATLGKLRILCLHGYSMHASLFAAKMHRVTRALDDVAEFTFLDAPHEIEPSPAFSGVDLRGLAARAWWRPAKVAHGWLYDGVEESVDAVARRHAEMPFDGLLGYSQGAALVSLLAALSAREPAHALAPAALRAFPPAFVLCAGGFRFNAVDSAYDGVLDGDRPLVDLPSLHVIGRNDAIIRPKLSADLAACFGPAPATTLEHDNGHVVDHSPGSLDAYRRFLEGFRARP